MSFVDDFLAGLEADKPAERTSNSINKVRMEVLSNQGTIIFAPFSFKSSKKFYELVPKVKEVRVKSHLYKDGAEEVWCRILPKEMYGELTPEQSKLYDEVNALYEALYDKTDDYYIIRVRSYSIFQGIVLNHINTENKQVDSSIGKACLISFPSREPINALITATNAKINECGGSSDWIPLLFTDNLKGREGVMNISFKKNPTKAGYNSSVAFGFNASFNKLITDETLHEEETVKLVEDGLYSFLAWQSGENSRFNEALFNDLKTEITALIRRIDTQASEAKQTEANSVKAEATEFANSASDGKANASGVPNNGLPF